MKVLLETSGAGDALLLDAIAKTAAEWCDFERAERMMLFWGGVVDKMAKAGKGPAR